MDVNCGTAIEWALRNDPARRGQSLKEGQGDMFSESVQLGLGELEGLLAHETISDGVGEDPAITDVVLLCSLEPATVLGIRWLVGNSSPGRC